MWGREERVGAELAAVSRRERRERDWIVATEGFTLKFEVFSKTGKMDTEDGTFQALVERMECRGYLRKPLPSCCGGREGRGGDAGFRVAGAACKVGAAIL